MNINRDGSHKFPRTGAIFVLAILASVVLPSHANPYKRWDFDKYNDRQGWTLSPSTLGVVMGGSLWVALNPKETDPAKIAHPFYQTFGDMFDGENNMLKENYDPGFQIESPRGIEIATFEEQQVQVRIKVLNLSPVTDLFLRWRTKKQREGWGAKEESWKQFSQSGHCALKADLKKWQDITCYVDKQWNGVIDQIAIYIPQAIRGDMWFSSIEIAPGPSRPIRARPDVASAAVVPWVIIPGVSQAGFAEAFEVLDKCLVVDVPLYGFTHPYMSAGGYYWPYWFPWDTSLALSGAKWANPGFAEGVMQGFHDVQAESTEGRIDILGISVVRGQPGDVSQVPSFFEVAYEVARRTNDPKMRGEIYQTMQRYLEWWLSPVKRDGRTGLVSGVFDEAFGDPDYAAGKLLPQSVAPVDLNVAVAVGAARTADLAAVLGIEKDAQRYRKVFQDLSRAINSILWDEQDGVYYNYDLRGGHARKRLIVSTFNPLRLGIADVERRDRLLKRLTDPAQFNWGKRPLTSLSKTDPSYVEAKTLLDGSWSGDIWIYRNMEVIKGLEESGRPDLAAELSWSTVKTFHMNYREFVVPSTGKGLGAEDYAMSASQYVEAIVEHLFGIDFDRIRNRLRIEPHVPRALYGKEIALENLILPSDGDTRLSVRIKQPAMGAAKITVNIRGPLPEGSLEIALPGSEKAIAVPAARSVTADFP